MKWYTVLNSFTLVNTITRWEDSDMVTGAYSLYDLKRTPIWTQL